MRAPVRYVWFVAAALATGAALAGVAPACGTDAVGVDACRQIDDARCTATQACGATQDAIDSCTLFYRDECLHGVANSTGAPSDAQVKDCVEAIQTVQGCASKGGMTTIADCVGAPIDPTVPICIEGVNNALLTPCQVISTCASVLQACSWANAPVADAGADSGGASGTGGAGGGAGGTGGNGGAATTASTSSSTAASSASTSTSSSTASTSASTTAASSTTSGAGGAGGMSGAGGADAGT